MSSVLKPVAQRTPEIHTDWFELPNRGAAYTVYKDRLFAEEDYRNGGYRLFHEVSRAALGITHTARRQLGRGLDIRDVLVQQAVWQRRQEKAGRQKPAHPGFPGTGHHYKGVLQQTRIRISAAR